MILKKEIAEIALHKKVAKSTIDKDWALGHYLDAIFSVDELRESLIFKGDTCLKKCYISDYRFSEDIDFTAINKNFKLTRKHLNEITGLLKQRTEMLTHIESLKNIIYKNKPVGYEALIKFWGSDHPRNEAPPAPERWQTKIKIEVISYELLIFPVAKRDIYHPYSDKLTADAIGVPCYTIEEMLAEKLRALIQRSYTAPRDYFDIWYLTKRLDNLNYENIVKAFLKKLEFKNHTFTGIEQLLNPENDRQLKAAWKNSLAHQIPDELPSFDIVRKDLSELFLNAARQCHVEKNNCKKNGFYNNILE